LPGIGVIGVGDGPLVSGGRSLDLFGFQEDLLGAIAEPIIAASPSNFT
jgi:hypothetical protein